MPAGARWRTLLPNCWIRSRLAIRGRARRKAMVLPRPVKMRGRYVVLATAPERDVITGIDRRRLSEQKIYKACGGEYASVCARCAR